MYFENFSIPESRNQQEIIELADLAIILHKDLQTKRSRFLKRLQNQPDWGNIKITSALVNFDTLTFVEFLRELSKQKIKLSLAQQDDWEEYFDQYKLECNDITEQISVVDKQIDQLVYQLYNLTEEEISIIESN